MALVTGVLVRDEIRAVLIVAQGKVAHGRPGAPPAEAPQWSTLVDQATPSLPVGVEEDNASDVTVSGRGERLEAMQLKAPTAVRRPALRMLADTPLIGDGEDRLGFAAYADALAHLVDHPDTDTPMTIAISAGWGAGKTSLANMVARRLWRWPVQRYEEPHIICRFNGLEVVSLP